VLLLLRMKRKSLVFPKLNQREMAAFLAIKPERLEWAGRECIIDREKDKFYRPEIVTPQWLEYERERLAKKAGTSELEQQRVRLVRAKAEREERRLALMDRSLLSTHDIVESVKMVCLRIKSKLQAALPRLARGCHHALNVPEALRVARTEFDLLIGELGALDGAGTVQQFEVVRDDADGERTAGSTPGRNKKKRTG
jgi:hypothetical protein